MMSNNDLPRQIIICCETDRKTGSDFIYVNEIIRYYYEEVIKNNNISIQYVPLGGKHKYNHPDTINKIDFYPKVNKTVIIYVFDKDQNHLDPRDLNFIKEVEEYCGDNDYEIIYFVKEIEEVLNTRTGKKTKEANKFVRQKGIERVKTQLLSNPNPQTSGSSNILHILNSILGRTNVKVP